MPQVRTPTIVRHRFTRGEYDRMIDAGVFGPGDRVELIHGEIIQMSPQNNPHRAAVALGVQTLQRICPETAYISPQSSLPLGEHTKPEPDLAVVVGSPRDHRHEDPSSILLIVEVADTSLGYDRTAKRRLYAEHGIPEYWIVNLQADRLEVYRNPAASDYAFEEVLNGEDAVAPLFAPDAVVAARDMIP